ncbi:MAG: hypothetical protein OXI22_06615 [Defluviicoccus sp.]|nr:hypothetical protein [Defluviicoccus sp.]MDE2914562.1 hypothetical protein [Paracoccaceae bacterium]
MEWPHSHSEAPDTPVILDLLEFCARTVGLPVERDFHPHFGHHHISWDRNAGLASLVSDVNLHFARNGVAYELTPEGEARRLLPTPLAKALGRMVFVTGDGETDQLLETAGQRIARPRIENRRDALEKLWDAFERLKTLEPGSNKRVQTERFLDEAAAPDTKFR